MESKFHLAGPTTISAPPKSHSETFLAAWLRSPDGSLVSPQLCLDQGPDLTPVRDHQRCLSETHTHFQLQFRYLLIGPGLGILYSLVCFGTVTCQTHELVPNNTD